MALNSLKESNALVSKEYKTFLREMKEKIASSQLEAAVAVNKELVALYWEVGSKVYLKQSKEGWGAKTIAKLAKDLKSAFPEIKGFSLTNIKYMVQFVKEYPDFTISQQAVGQIPWGRNILIIQKLESEEERIWYAKKTIEHGWSRAVLHHWIDSKIHIREGGAVSKELECLQGDNFL